MPEKHVLMSGPASHFGLSPWATLRPELEAMYRDEYLIADNVMRFCMCMLMSVSTHVKMYALACKRLTAS